MTKKKQRSRLARALRREGIEGGAAFRLARVIVRAGSPAEVGPEEYAVYGVEVFPGHFCQERAKHLPTEAIGPGGACIGSAWRASF